MLLVGKSTISMAMFNSFLYVYQRIDHWLVDSDSPKTINQPGELFADDWGRDSKLLSTKKVKLHVSQWKKKKFVCGHFQTHANMFKNHMFNRIDCLPMINIIKLFRYDWTHQHRYFLMVSSQFLKVVTCPCFIASTAKNNYIKPTIFIWLVVDLPLWEIWVRQLGLLFPIYGKINFMFQTTNQL